MAQKVAHTLNVSGWGGGGGGGGYSQSINLDEPQ